MKRRFSSTRFVVLFLAIATFFTISLILSLSRQNAAERSPEQGTFDKFAAADAVTRDIRDGSKQLTRVTVRGEEDRSALGEYGRIVADHGAFVVVATDRGADLGGLHLESQPVETSVNLPGAKFDPVLDPPAGTVRPGADEPAGQKGYYVIQFGGIVSDDWLDSVRDAGVQILQYVPHNAFFVYADARSIARAASHSRVRWVGAYTPDQKLSDELVGDLESAGKNGVSPFEMRDRDRAAFDVSVWSRADLSSVKASLMSRAQVEVISESVLPNNYFSIVRVLAPLGTVADLARIPDVITVNAYSTPRAEDERSSQIISGNYTTTISISGPGYNPLAQFGADGTDVTVGMIDDGVSIPGNGGFYITAANTLNGPLRGGSTGASGGHGHINASIIAGAAPFGNLDGLGYNYGLGVAPRANIVNIPFLFGYSGTDANMVDDSVSTAGVNGVRTFIINNSWGSGAGGAGQPYTARAASFDGFVRDSSSAGTIDPLVIVFSSGNQGTLGMTDPKAAKNIITTGNSENLRPELSIAANNMDDLTGSSSRGPAADGRVKPDITAPGTVITGSRAGNCSSVSSCFETNHSWSSGTSHAAPQVAGAAALFTNSWKNMSGGVNPSVALVKAAILNTGQEMAGANVAAAIPNGAEGWGRMNMKLMLNTGVPMKHVNETVSFSDPGNSATFTGTVGDATKPIRVALVWTDPPGAAGANPALVNNLDLTVTVGSDVYKGNVLTGGLSTTGGAADTINNVEMVRLAAGAAVGTTFTIQVSATALNGDGILGNADVTDQHFALVAYNFAATPRTRADFDGDGRTDLSVFRPSDGIWYLNRSLNGFAAQNWGLNGDVPIPGDYDSDGRTDIAIFRGDANQANPDFFVLRSSNGTFTSTSWGLPGDTPMTGDFDGDLRTDFAVFRPSSSTWYIQNSGGSVRADNFGAPGDLPLVMDYEADGLSNIAVFRPSDNIWYIAKPTGVPAQSFYAIPFGASTDLPAPADYDGDGRDDVAVFRPADGTWFVLRSSNGVVDTTPFGLTGDVPVPGDYDGDGRDDLAVYRGGTWYLNRTTSGPVQFNFGTATDIPIPKKYIP